MNNIAFGRLINVLTIWGMRELELHEMINLEQLVEPVQVPLVEKTTVSEQAVCALLDGMNKKEKIDAIKAYRVLTNVGLKEAKDAVERYW